MSKRGSIRILFEALGTQYLTHDYQTISEISSGCWGQCSLYTCSTFRHPRLTSGIRVPREDPARRAPRKHDRSVVRGCQVFRIFAVHSK